LEGLETLNVNELIVIVPNSPYFKAFDVFVPATKSLEPIRVDVKLRRGVWVVGRAYDRVTGKLVSGTVSYTPFLSNEFERKFPPIQTKFIQGDVPARVDAEGRFRVLAIPGRGVVRLQCNSGDYRFDYGKPQIKSSDEPRLAAAIFHAVREINVAPDAHEASVDLPVDPGQNVVLKFTDAAGNGLAGVEAYGLRFVPGSYGAERGRSFAEGDSATLYTVSPDEPRTIWLRHRASGLAKFLEFTPKAGETERTIVLEVPAVVTGRLVTSEGTPIPKVQIECRFGLGPSQLPGVSTDSQGRFRQELPAGGPFALSTQPYSEFAEKLTVVAGEQVDFGDIAIDLNQERPRMAKKPHSPVKRTRPQVDPEFGETPKAARRSPSVNRPGTSPGSASGIRGNRKETRASSNDSRNPRPCAPSQRSASRGGDGAGH
jgi:hypothetical protein